MSQVLEHAESYFARFRGERTPYHLLAEGTISALAYEAVRLGYKNLDEFLRRGKVLDIGCDVGLIVKCLKNCGVDIYGIDLEKDRRSDWKHDGIGNITTVADAQRLPFKDETFSLVLTQALFTDPLFEDTSSVRMVIPEIWRVLQKGGFYYSLDGHNVLKSYCPEVFSGEFVSIVKKE